MKKCNYGNVAPMVERGSEEPGDAGSNPAVSTYFPGRHKLMGLFGALVRTVINVAVTPLPMLKDVVTLGGTIDGNGSYTLEHLEKIKQEADEE